LYCYLIIMYMFKHLFFIICLSLTLVSPLLAQKGEGEEPEYDFKFKNSYFTGGSLGLQFGSVVSVDVSPQIGYYPLEHISVGAGFTYQYISNRMYSPRAEVNVYGGRVFSRLYLPIFESIFAHLEYEYMAYRTNIFSLNGEMDWIKLNNFLAGAGYRQRFGGRSSVNLMLLWNFNESQYSLSSNPIIRIGVDIGL
jgi:hypothetical protein